MKVGNFATFLGTKMLSFILMKKYFLYGCGIGLLAVFIIPWIFGGVCLCGPESNSWINVTSRLYSNTDDTYIFFGRIFAILFVLVSGLVFILVRYIKSKFSKQIPTQNVEMSLLEKIFRNILLIILVVFVITITYIVLKVPSRYTENPPAPGLFNSMGERLDMMPGGINDPAKRWEIEKWKSLEVKELGIVIKYPEKFEIDHDQFFGTTTAPHGDFYPGGIRGGDADFYGTEGYLDVYAKEITGTSTQDCPVFAEYPILMRKATYIVDKKEIPVFFTKRDSSVRTDNLGYGTYRTFACLNDEKTKMKYILVYTTSRDNEIEKDYIQRETLFGLFLRAFKILN